MLRAQLSGEETIVRVFFDDPPTGRLIAASLEPIESKYENGCLVVEVTAEQLGGVAENGKTRTPSHRQRPVSDLNRRACGVAARQAFQLHWVFGFRSLPPG